MTWSAADYQLALLEAAPPGLAFPRDPNSNWGKVVGAHADGFARIEQAAEALIAEIVPSNADAMLPEWQEQLGVPEPGTDTGALTDAEIRAQLVAKDTAIGGQSPGYFTGIAAQLGFTVTISKYTVARIGARIGDRLYDESWAYAWLVTVTEAPAGFVKPAPDFRGADAAPANVLEIYLHKFEPAEGALLFDYSGI